MSEQERLGTAIKTISEKYLGNVIAAGDTAGILKWSTRLADYATRLAAIVSPPLTKAEAFALGEPAPVDPDYFRAAREDDTTVFTSSGLAFTYADARKWWEIVFGQGLNIGKVAPDNTPGSDVLSPAGYAAAVALGKSSTTFAPADFNPLGLGTVS